MNISSLILAECCGTTCNKTDILCRVRELEEKNKELQNIIDDARANSAINREKFAFMCFNEGMSAVELNTSDTFCDTRHWLNFKATKL